MKKDHLSSNDLEREKRKAFERFSVQLDMYWTVDNKAVIVTIDRWLFFHFNLNDYNIKPKLQKKKD